MKPRTGGGDVCSAAGQHAGLGLPCSIGHGTAGHPCAVGAVSTGLAIPHGGTSIQGHAGGCAFKKTITERQRKYESPGGPPRHEDRVLEVVDACVCALDEVHRWGGRSIIYQGSCTNAKDLACIRPLIQISKQGLDCIFL